MRVDTAVLHRFSLRAPIAAALICATLTLSGCAMFRKDAPVAATGAEQAAAGAQTTQATKLQKFFWIFTPYRPDIQQGNFVSQEMLAQVQVGQTREQVKFILGTPLMADVFHADRWDYPFYLARGNGDLTKSQVSVFFKDDKVEKFEGGNLPTEKEYIARIAGAPISAEESKRRADDAAIGKRRENDGKTGK